MAWASERPAEVGPHPLFLSSPLEDFASANERALQRGAVVRGMDDTLYVPVLHVIIYSTNEKEQVFTGCVSEALAGYLN
jgi:hypothetical protein